MPFVHQSPSARLACLLLVPGALACQKSEADPETSDTATTDSGFECPSDTLSTAPFLLDADAPIPQIHPDVAFDGQAIWLVYNVPASADSTFDVRAQLRDPFGASIVAPFDVNTRTGANETYPRVAHNTHTLIVWQSDDSSSTGRVWVLWATRG